MTKEQMQQQIDKAREDLRKLKRATPHLFPEYSRLHCARRALAAAKDELKAAQKAWDALGRARP